MCVEGCLVDFALFHLLLLGSERINGERRNIATNPSEQDVATVKS